MRDLNISLIQTSVVWEDKQTNLNHFSQKISQVGSADLIVLPEMFNTGFTMDASRFAESMDGETIQWIMSNAKRLNKHIAGSLIVEELGLYYNRFVCASPNGALMHYDKRHAFSMAGEDKVFAKGQDRVVWDINGWKICPMVCYDLRFPVWSRNNLNYDVLLYTANWPTKRINHWLTLAKARAIENQCYVAAVSRIGTDGVGIEYNGNSIICDFDGESLSHNEGKDTIVATTLSYANLQARRTQFKVLHDKDDFSLT
jgi:omega-amidase